MKRSKLYIFKRQLLSSLKGLQILKILLPLVSITLNIVKVFYLISQSDVRKNILSSNTEISKTILLNSDLPLNKIVDVHTYTIIWIKSTEEKMKLMIKF